jgi:KipI family sensor histidine kinase inhibitor
VLPRFLAAADSALDVELGDEVSDAVSGRVLALDALLAARPPAGMVEVIPSLRSLLLEYDALRTSQARLRRDVEALLPLLSATPVPRGTEHSITVVYDGPDLDAVAAATGLSREQVVARHTSGTYRVGMLGNLPGLPYLLGLDPSLRVPRRADPRDAVPRGAVAIAGELSCVYPVSGPGGWNLIGHTLDVLFDPRREMPALLAPGDTVRFVAAAAAAAPRATDAGATSDTHRGPALHVIEPGLLTTVQDAGRRGWQRSGVPVCGALDAELLRVANLLAGNAPGAAALELTHTGPLLVVRAPSVRVAVAGDCEVTRIGRDGSESDVGAWRSLVLRDGERLHVGRVRSGLRGILAVEGGIAVAPVLGSRSTHLRARLGGLDGRALRRGDVLPLARAYAGHHPDLRLLQAALHDAQLVSDDAITTVRAVTGPQDAAVDAESLHALFATELVASPRSDRVGLRLDGLRLRHRGSAEVISDGCAPGSVQVPGSGQPIVLLADRGTTGGYPKVATVAGADMTRLARLRPGDRLRLARIEVAEAEALRRHRESLLAALADALEPVAAT